MRIITVNPAKPLGFLMIQPLPGSVDNIPGFPFTGGKFHELQLLILFVIEIESLGKSKPGVEGIPPDKSGR
jgi:hypothetical protein